MSEFATTLAAVVTGGVITYVTTASADRGMSRREREERDHARTVDEERRRLDFQSEALVGAQEGLLALWSSSTDFGARRREDIRAGRAQMDEANNDAVMNAVAAARSTFTMYLERIADDQVRAVLWNAARTLQAITTANTEAQMSSAWAEMGTAVDEANKALGSALRGLY